MRVVRVLILLIVGLMWSCSPHDELEIPSNPLDPDNPVYTTPNATIIGGPGEGEVIVATSATFTWQGNETAIEYSYMHDNADWSDWSQHYSTTLDYLDEGVHTFEVKARSINGVVQQIPHALGFTVDAISGPAAIVYPYLQKANPGDTLVYQIIAEEVSDLFAVEVNISIDDEYLELIDVIDGELLGEWGGEVLRIQEVSGSNVSLSVVAVEGESNSFAGTTSLISFRIRAKQTVNMSIVTDVVELIKIVYLNSELDRIEIASVRPGVIVVK